MGVEYNNFKTGLVHIQILSPMEMVGPDLKTQIHYDISICKYIYFD